MKDWEGVKKKLAVRKLKMAKYLANVRIIGALEGLLLKARVKVKEVASAKTPTPMDSHVSSLKFIVACFVNDKI